MEYSLHESTETPSDCPICQLRKRMNTSMDLAVLESFLSWSVIVTFELEGKHPRHVIDAYMKFALFKAQMQTCYRPGTEPETQRAE